MQCGGHGRCRRAEQRLRIVPADGVSVTCNQPRPAYHAALIAQWAGKHRRDGTRRSVLFEPSIRNGCFHLGAAIAIPGPERLTLAVPLGSCAFWPRQDEMRQRARMPPLGKSANVTGRAPRQLVGSRDSAVIRPLVRGTPHAVCAPSGCGPPTQPKPPCVWLPQSRGRQPAPIARASAWTELKGSELHSAGPDPTVARRGSQLRSRDGKVWRSSRGACRSRLGRSWWD